MEVHTLSVEVEFAGDDAEVVAHAAETAGLGGNLSEAIHALTMLGCAVRSSIHGGGAA
jgi:hypothetical protein